ncbi:MAG: DUF547 domain-containing protein [Rickettsiaceae bacterium]|nr:DUF547 domain-containing protein [Rickettsiaceae bacterium]
MQKALKFFIIISIWLINSIIYAGENDYIIPYSKLLKNYVSKGIKEGIETTLVDYDSWQNDVNHVQAMQSLLVVNPGRFNAEEKKSFWINAYNLLTIDLIINSTERRSIKNLGTIFRSPWKKYSWKINGKNYTLDEIEHDILRPMGDARIHMAINCSAISCPDLLNKPYMADNLDQQLDYQVILFLKNPTKGVKITRAGLEISRIFKWFVKDFGGNEALEKFIFGRLNMDFTTETSIKYLDYNWNLNIKK